MGVNDSAGGRRFAFLFAALVAYAAWAGEGRVLLTDLKPRWWATEGRKAQGLTFECPLCHRQRLGVAFSPTFDGGPPATGQPVWQRTGDTFETLTLSPSVDSSQVKRREGESDADYAARSRPCTQGGESHWHGFITNGAVQ